MIFKCKVLAGTCFQHFSVQIMFIQVRTVWRTSTEQKEISLVNQAQKKEKWMNSEKIKVATES